jgi:outer membrane protein assembly factor BamB
MRTIAVIFLFLILQDVRAQLATDTLWSLKTEKYCIGNPLLEDGVFYTANEKGKVMAIEVASGKLLWESKVDGGLYHNMVSTDKALIMACAKSSDVVLSLDKKTGMQNWKAQNGYNFDDDAPCLLVKDGNQVIFNSLDSTIVSLDIHSGKELWKYKAGGITSPPVLNGDMVVVTCANGYIYQVSKQTGKPGPKISFGGAKRRAMYMPPVIYDNILVLSDTGQVITAISLTSQKIIWTQQGKSPFLFGFDEYAVSATDEGLHAYDIKTGKEAWSLPGRHEWYIYPFIFEKRFYYYSRKEGRLLVIDKKGEIQLFYSLSGKTYTAPRATKEKIILSVSDKIFAVGNK